MKITTALVCGSAEVREGLLFVLGGGITRLWRDQWPAPLGVAVAVVLEMSPAEARQVHEVTLRILDTDGRRLGEVKGGFQLSVPEASSAPGAPHPGEMVSVPIVLPLHVVGVPGPGAYEFKLAVDRNAASSRLTVWAERGKPV